MLQQREIVPFGFTLVPAHSPEELHENMRSSIARNLPTVHQVSTAHDGVLSIAGGGPSLADTCNELEGYVAAINGSLQFLLDRGIVPQMCGMCDPSPHMVDIIAADPRVTYFLASIVHPAVYDKLLNAGCTVYRWNSSAVPGGERVLATYDPDTMTIGGGSTMGLRWIVLGYTFGFRKFRLHGFDSSFRSKSSHAYPDHQDSKDWITFEGFSTRPNFIGQVVDFINWMERLKDEDVEPLDIRVLGDGLLQAKFRQWKGSNPGWHEGPPKPYYDGPTAGFEWPAGDVIGKPAALAGVRDIEKFMAFIKRRGTVVQAGGGVGAYPAYLARHFAHVFTFEPEPENYALLERNLQKAKGNIRAFNAALGDRNGTCGLRKPDPANAGHVLVTGGDSIPMRRIDDLDLHECDLIWLDVEGHELQALKGADRTIREHLPAVIFEDAGLTVAHDTRAAEITDWLHERGYVFAVKYGNDRLFVPAC